MTDFDLCTFLDKNENIIRDISINTHIRNGSTDSLYFSAFTMLNEHNRKHPKHKIKIDTGFPKDKLVNCMRPYLELYMISRYSNEDSKGQTAEKMLQYKLKKLYKYNPNFGKKIIKLKNIKMFGRLMRREITYCDNMPKFIELYDRETFQNSHLEIAEFIFDNEVDVQYNNDTYNTGYDRNNNDQDDDAETEEDAYEDEIPSPTNATIVNIEVDDLIDSDSESESEIQNVEQDSDDEIIIEGSDTDH
jgi:hypothetical protein